MKIIVILTLGTVFCASLGLHAEDFAPPPLPLQLTDSKSATNDDAKKDTSIPIKDLKARMEKNDPEAWFVAGVLEEQTGHDDKAVVAYLRVLQISPQHVNALNNLGLLAAKKDQTKEALDYWERAVAAHPPSADACYNLGRALVITKTDYRRGVLLLGAVAQTNTNAGKRARDFMNEMLKWSGEPNAAVAANAPNDDDKAVDGIPFPNFYSIKPHIKSPLFLAIMGGHVKEALEAVQGSNNVNERIEELGLTPLMVAASMGQVSVVRALVAKTADISAVDKNGRTALEYACLNMRVTVAKTLIQAGANVNAKDRISGDTPLISATIGTCGNEASRKFDLEHQIDVVALLIEHGADVNIQDNNGRTALYHAAVNDWVVAEELLIKHGSKDIKDKDGWSATMMTRDEKIKQLLMQAAKQ